MLVTGATGYVGGRLVPALLHTLEGHEGRVRAIAWNPTSTQVLTGFSDEVARVGDASTGDGMQLLRGHEQGVHSVAWNASGTRIASGS